MSNRVSAGGDDESTRSLSSGPPPPLPPHYAHYICATLRPSSLESTIAMDLVLPIVIAGGIHLLSWFGEPLLSPLYSRTHLGTIVDHVTQLLSFDWLLGMSAARGEYDDATASMFSAGGTKHAAALAMLFRSRAPYCMVDFLSQPTCVATYNGLIYSETGDILLNATSTALRSHPLLKNPLFTATLLSALSLYVFVIALSMAALSVIFSLVFPARSYPKFMGWTAVAAFVCVQYGWQATAAVFYTAILSGLGFYKRLFGDISAEEEADGVGLLPGAFDLVIAQHLEDACRTAHPTSSVLGNPIVFSDTALRSLSRSPLSAVEASSSALSSAPIVTATPSVPDEFMIPPPGKVYVLLNTPPISNVHLVEMDEQQISTFKPSMSTQRFPSLVVSNMTLEDIWQNGSPRSTSDCQIAPPMKPVMQSEPSARFEILKTAESTDVFIQGVTTEELKNRSTHSSSAAAIIHAAGDHKYKSTQHVTAPDSSSSIRALASNMSPFLFNIKAQEFRPSPTVGSRSSMRFYDSHLSTPSSGSGSDYSSGSSSSPYNPHASAASSDMGSFNTMRTRFWSNDGRSPTPNPSYSSHHGQSRVLRALDPATLTMDPTSRLVASVSFEKEAEIEILEKEAMASWKGPLFCADIDDGIPRLETIASVTELGEEVDGVEDDGEGEGEIDGQGALAEYENEGGEKEDIAEANVINSSKYCPPALRGVRPQPLDAQPRARSFSENPTTPSDAFRHLGSLDRNTDRQRTISERDVEPELDVWWLSRKATPPLSAIKRAPRGPAHDPGPTSSVICRTRLSPLKIKEQTNRANASFHTTAINEPSHSVLEADHLKRPSVQEGPVSPNLLLLGEFLNRYRTSSRGQEDTQKGKVEASSEPSGERTTGWIDSRTGRYRTRSAQAAENLRGVGPL